MGLIGGTFGSWILKQLCPAGDSGYLSGEAYANKSKLAVLLGDRFFEHFDDPAHILRVMDSYLAPGGKVIATFGPTWYHPLGGHLFSVFPWAHLVFTERALLRWRKSIRPNQTATRLTECGLNKITIRRFEQIVAASPFRFERFEAKPIRGLQLLGKGPLREFGTAIVRCTLVRRSEAPAAAAAA